MKPNAYFSLLNEGFQEHLIFSCMKLSLFQIFCLRIPNLTVSLTSNGQLQIYLSAPETKDSVLQNSTLA